MNDNFQYGDIIFLAMIALFIAFRLRAMLGKNSGIDPKDVWKNATRNNTTEKVVPFPDKNKKPEDDFIPANFQVSPETASGLRAIKLSDATFNITEFLAGAKTAFEWVVDAFSKGDKDKLKILLSEERFKHFCEEIDLHANDEAKRETTLVAITACDITEAGMKGKIAFITVQFTSEQINLMRDKDKNIVQGDPSVTEQTIDLWTLERDISSRDPNWKIVAT